MHSNRANVLLKMNRLEEALQSAEDCLRMDSNWFKVSRMCSLKHIVWLIKGVVAKCNVLIFFGLKKNYCVSFSNLFIKPCI